MTGLPNVPSWTRYSHRREAWIGPETKAPARPTRPSTTYCNLNSPTKSLTPPPPQCSCSVHATPTNPPPRATHPRPTSRRPARSPRRPERLHQHGQSHRPRPARPGHGARPARARPQTAPPPASASSAPSRTSSSARQTTPNATTPRS